MKTVFDEDHILYNTYYRVLSQKALYIKAFWGFCPWIFAKGGFKA